MNKLTQMFAGLMTVLAQAKANGLEGSIAQVIGGLVVGIVMLFVGIFMIDAVSTATAINASSDFYTTNQNLITTTGTIFSVLGLVIIIVALATAIRSLQSMG